MAVKKTAFFVGALAGASIAVAAIAGAGMKLPAIQPHGGSLIPASTAPIFAPPPGAPQSFADIFERVSPAVVSIHVTSKMDVAALRKAIPGFENFPFDLVPKGQGQGQGQGGDSEDRPLPKQQSSGSGFFISSDGFIVTNNHVIDGAEDIKVVTKDGSELKATVIGRDEGTDLAVLKVNGANFPFVSFETSVRPRVGDWVVAVGNPFDLNGTATAGIVSAYNRDLQENFVDYIQIDAPINRGNSGGPTFDVYGRVIGVNAAIYSPTGGSVGIGFAIPADVAEQVTKQLIAHGKITRGYIGATIQNLSDDLASSWGLAGRKGAQVTDLVPGGPAQKAGLEPGDVVVAVNGAPVKTNIEMTREVAKSQAGDVIHLDVFRAGKERTVDIRSGLRPSEQQLAQNGQQQDQQDQGAGGADHAPAAGPAVLGMQLAPLNPSTRGQYNIPDTVKGGVVVQSAKNTCDAGGDNCLQRGDVIVQAGDKEVASAGDVVAAVSEWKKAGRTSIPLGVRRGGQTTAFVPIKIEG
ncbi:MAG TPA: trypsin-like peptidase domain-containing protein [Caulobacteraceae bacterium]|jgi:serine protease Do|nr:trypsin-like peptidase domain-containing protein [Caulobacteraceae bacterium]